MFNKKILVAIVTVVLLLFGALTPRPARAADITTGLIIAGAAVGVVTLITAIAVLATHDDEPHFLAPDARVPPPSAHTGFRVGLQCKTPDGQPALFCW